MIQENRVLELKDFNNTKPLDTYAEVDSEIFKSSDNQGSSNNQGFLKMLYDCEYTKEEFYKNILQESIYDHLVENLCFTQSDFLKNIFDVDFEPLDTKHSNLTINKAVKFGRFDTLCIHCVDTDMINNLMDELDILHDHKLVIFTHINLTTSVSPLLLKYKNVHLIKLATNEVIFICSDMENTEHKDLYLNLKGYKNKEDITEEIYKWVELYEPDE